MHKWGQVGREGAARRSTDGVSSRPSIFAPVTQVTECSAGIRDNDRHCCPQDPQLTGIDDDTDLGEIIRDGPAIDAVLLRHGALALPFILVVIPARAVERVGSVEDSKGEAFAELDAVRRTLDRAVAGLLGDGVVTASRPDLNAARPRYDDQAWRTSCG